MTQPIPDSAEPTTTNTAPGESSRPPASAVTSRAPHPLTDSDRAEPEGAERVPTDAPEGAAPSNESCAPTQPPGRLDPELLAEDPNAAPRVIKRYSNRKLYDTHQSRYVTLLQIAEMVRAGEDVQIIDNATKEDKTDVTLALIISEELKARPRAIPLATLRALIRNRGGKLLSQLRESPIGRLIPADEEDSDHVQEAHGPILVEESSVTKESPGAIRRTLEQWQHTIDDRIRAVVPQFSTIQQLQRQVGELTERLEQLEKRLPPSGE